MEEFLINYYFYIYGTSLTDLKHTTFCREAMITKSSIMLGLGETGEEVKQASTYILAQYLPLTLVMLMHIFQSFLQSELPGVSANRYVFDSERVLHSC